MSTEDIKIALQVVNMLATFGVGIYVWVSTQDKVTNKRISELEVSTDKRLDDHSDRLARVEQDVQHAPDDEDIKRLHARIDELGGSLRRLEGEFVGANRTLSLIHEFLLKQGQ